MIRTVIFDIDGTMYDFTVCNKKAIEAVGDYCRRNLSLPESDFKEALKAAGATANERIGSKSSAIHNRLIRYQCMLERLGQPIFPHALAMCRAYWETLFEQMEPYPGLEEFMQGLKGRGIRVGIGTNMTAFIQYKKLECLGAAPFVDWILTSEEAGEEKPAEKFFKLCVEKSQCEAAQCLFIGDSLEGDVEGALKCGMKALHFNPASCPEASGENPREQPYETVYSYYDCEKYV